MQTPGPGASPARSLYVQTLKKPKDFQKGFRGIVRRSPWRINVARGRATVSRDAGRDHVCLSRPHSRAHVAANAWPQRGGGVGRAHTQSPRTQPTHAAWAGAVVQVEQVCHSWEVSQGSPSEPLLAAERVCLPRATRRFRVAGTVTGRAR